MPGKIMKQCKLLTVNWVNFEEPDRASTWGTVQLRGTGNANSTKLAFINNNCMKLFCKRTCYN